MMTGSCDRKGVGYRSWLGPPFPLFLLAPKRYLKMALRGARRHPIPKYASTIDRMARPPFDHILLRTVEWALSLLHTPIFVYIHTFDRASYI